MRRFAAGLAVAGLLALGDGPNGAAAGEVVPPPTIIPVTIETMAGPRQFQAEVACTREERSRGLMGRTRLAPEAGMIFLLPAPRPMRMWMKDTPLALDLVFFDSKHQIIALEQNAQPMSEHVIESGGAVSGVLELAGGRTAELGISRSDRIIYDYPQSRCE